MIWWNTFPRKIGNPMKQVAHNSREFIELFSKINGHSDKVYMGIYACDSDGKMNKVRVNVALFDLDWNRSYESMKELHNKLVEKDWMHQVMFSTGGFWLYVHCVPRTYDKAEAKMRLAAMQDYIIKDTTLEFGDPKVFPLDRSIRGDVERITRCPGSYDKRRKLYAIFLNDQDIDGGFDYIKEVSRNCDEKRRFTVYTFGQEIAVDPQDMEVKANNSSKSINMPSHKWNVETPENLDKFTENLLKSLPPCVRSWIVEQESATWVARAYATLYLREKGFSQETTQNFLKEFYINHKRTDPIGDNWNHYLNHARTGDAIYRRDDLFFPNCDTLFREGMCKGACKLYRKGKSVAYK